jgi:hypothetical protein
VLGQRGDFSSGNVGLLAEKLQLPREGGPGSAGVRHNQFAKRLRGLLASPVALPFARDRQPVNRHHAKSATCWSTWSIPTA